MKKSIILASFFKKKNSVIYPNTLRDIENSAPRRNHRIEMKFNTRINKNERFT